MENIHKTAKLLTARQGHRTHTHKKIAPFGAEFLNQLEARAVVEPAYTDLQRISGHNLPYKTIGYRFINCCATICVMNFRVQVLLK
jgi:hypothetical protein